MWAQFTRKALTRRWWNWAEWWWRWRRRRVGCLGRSAFDLPTLLLPLSYDCKHCVNKVKSGRIISLPKQILRLFLSYSSIYIVFVIHTGLAWFLFMRKGDGQEILSYSSFERSAIITKPWRGLEWEKGKTKVSSFGWCRLGVKINEMES